MALSQSPTLTPPVTASEYDIFNLRWAAIEFCYNDHLYDDRRRSVKVTSLMRVTVSKMESIANRLLIGNYMAARPRPPRY